MSFRLHDLHPRGQRCGVPAESPIRVQGGTGKNPSRWELGLSRQPAPTPFTASAGALGQGDLGSHPALPPSARYLLEAVSVCFLACKVGMIRLW